MSEPKTMYEAAIVYRTPSGKRVTFYALVAAHTLSECDEEIQHRLRNEQRFGRRRVGTYVGEFSAVPVGKQIQTR